MQKRRRTPSGSAMDGFVRRNRTPSKPRASLDSSARPKKQDGFAPRHQDAHQPMQFDEKTEGWEDETLWQLLMKN